jgi:hypothetical protein
MRISSEAATRGEESGARIQEPGEAVVRQTVEIMGPSDATYLLQNNWRGAALARASRAGCVSPYHVLRQGNVKAGGSPQVARPTHTLLAPGFWLLSSAAAGLPDSQLRCYESRSDTRSKPRRELDR